MTNTISFPNIGIENLKIRETVFEIFGRPVAWYGLIITVGIILAVFYVLFFSSKKEGICSNDIMDLAIASIISAIVGARIYYVLMTIGDYESFYDVIAVWNGGLAIYGAIIAGGIAAFVVAKVKKIPFLKIFDMMSPAVILGQAIGRWGNFCNGEAYGSVSSYSFLFKTWNTPDATKLPWIMDVNGTLAHPTFLYESLWCIVGFIILNLIYKNKKRDGTVFFAYIAFYGFGRMFIEGFRTDSLYLGDIRVSQLVGLLCFIAGVVFLLIKKSNKSNLTETNREEQTNGKNH